VVGFDTSLLPDWWKPSIFIHVDARVSLLYIFIHALTSLPRTQCSVDHEHRWQA